MGTVLFWPLLSMSVSFVKTSVMGFLEYVSAKQGNIGPFLDTVVTLAILCGLD